MMDFGVSGLDEVITFLEGLSARLQTGLHTGLLGRAKTVSARFTGATPRRRGDTAEGWEPDDQGVVAGLATVAVVNRVKTKRGFLIASALLTGTGRRGAGATPARGYLGGFGATPGMFPAAALQTAWNEETSNTLATAEFVKAVGL